MIKKRNNFLVWLIVLFVMFIFPLLCMAEGKSDKSTPESLLFNKQEKTTVETVAVSNQILAQVGTKQDNAGEEKEPAVQQTEKTSVAGIKKQEASEAQKEKEEEQDMMERALDLLELADSSWEKGDVEDALDTLDRAYALILDTDGDVEIARQKDDLRLLISRRVLAIYSARQTVTSGKASEIPLIMNSDVEKEIRSFQGYEREFFISSYQRSGMYREMMIRELKKAGLPEELSWLPLVESGFKISALSSARALGLWQFIPSTGYKFGLNRDEWIDERMDAEKSTHAAIAYLKELHSMFGDWMTVLAAYNCGEGRVMRVISRQHVNYFDRFWDLYNQLPRETARYVPRFLATLHIIKNPSKYGMDLGGVAEKQKQYEIVKINKIMKLQDIAAKLEVSEDLLNSLNTELRYRITPDREYGLKIPTDLLNRFNLVSSEIPESEKPHFASSRTVFVKHRVRKGDTIANIAKKYRVSSSSIISYNRVSAKRGLVAGQKIRIPIVRQTKVVKSKSPVKTTKVQQSQSLAAGKNIYYVKKGDSLLLIAKKFDISPSQIKELNNLKTNTIRAGQKLKLSSSGNINNEEKSEDKNPKKKMQIANQMLSATDLEKLGTNKHIVTRGENLSIIARKNNVSVAKIMDLNNLSAADTLTPGQVLIIK